MRKDASNRHGIRMAATGLFLFLVCRFVHSAPLPPPPPLSSPKMKSPLKVWVIGEVKRPSEYPLTPGSTVSDAMDAAGGTTSKADCTRLNLSATILDGSILHVPSFQTGFVSRLTLNHSSALELVTLPGIGPVLAERIVEQREKKGLFKNARDLLRVPGIGPRKLKRILQHATLE
jgi:competence protein ComEA